jgi:hypothetical protein
MYKIAPCTCSHEYQDQKYGKGMRVFTPKMPSGKLSGWRCTVCKREIPVDSSDKAKTNKGEGE